MAKQIAALTLNLYWNDVAKCWDIRGARAGHREVTLLRARTTVEMGPEAPTILASALVDELETWLY